MGRFNYDHTNIHLRYDRARVLSSEALKLWLDGFSLHLPHHGLETVVDIGSGTGRFSGALADHFSATVYGVEPAEKMLRVARTTVVRSDVRFLKGSAEDIPLDKGVADLIFLSMVYHHIRDRAKALREFSRILKPSGRLCIRTSTRERLDSYLWLSFFPQARAIEVQRIPSSQELVESLQAGGFVLDVHEVVSQLIARDLSEYYERISLRGLSSLQAISDEAFTAGLLSLHDYCISQSASQAVHEEADLFVFSRAGASPPRS